MVLTLPALLLLPSKVMEEDGSAALTVKVTPPIPNIEFRE